MATNKSEDSVKNNQYGDSVVGYLTHSEGRSQEVHLFRYFQGKHIVISYQGSYLVSLFPISFNVIISIYLLSFDKIHLFHKKC